MALAGKLVQATGGDIEIRASFAPRRWLMLPVILIGSFLSFLDFFIVTIALPTIRADLNATPADLLFVVAAYGVAFGVSLITGGRLGDIYGRKRVFMFGIAGFTAASLLCGIAPNANWLIAARIMQAVSAAAVTPQVLAIIRTEFPPNERPSAIGFYGTSMGLASIMGQVFGGLLVSLNVAGWSWRLIFLVNLPVGLVALLLAAAMVPESRGEQRPTLDWGGVGLASLALFLLIFPVVAGREAGWPVWSFVMLAGAIPALAGFFAYQMRVIRTGATPLLALHLFQIPAIRVGLLASAAFFMGLGIFFVVMTITFQAGYGYTPLRTGLLFVPFAVAFCVASAASGRVTARLGPRVLNLGTGLMAIGLTVLLLGFRTMVSPGVIEAAFAIYGAGQGLAQPAMINTVIGSSGIAANDTGSAVGLFLTTAQSCMALGVAVIGDIFFWRLGEAGDYLSAASAVFGCNLALLAVAFGVAWCLPTAPQSRERAV